MTPSIEEALKSFGLLDSDKEVHSYAEELSPAFNLYAQSVAEKYNQISSQFLLYLDKDIQNGKNLLQSAKSKEDRTHIAACISTLYDVKEKFSQLINNK